METERWPRVRAFNFMRVYKAAALSDAATRRTLYPISHTHPPCGSCCAVSVWVSEPIALIHANVSAVLRDRRRSSSLRATGSRALSAERLRAAATRIVYPGVNVGRAEKRKHDDAVGKGYASQGVDRQPGVRTGAPQLRGGRCDRYARAQSHADRERQRSPHQAQRERIPQPDRVRE
ncbi:hypothetical protein Q5P01_000548 [Channa striata]|uniref:Uncharacterized protein n=1 Tax=Channa striata TaxID=64152 RepID=A0AA88LMK0_CHASR|nr:hypothetical protein Q5P01_000548 [Channa striata]